MKKSNSWKWVIGIVGAVVLFLGIVTAVFFGVAVALIDTNTNLNTNKNKNTTVPARNVNSASVSPIENSNSTSSTDDNKSSETIDFKSFAKESNQYAVSEIKDGEYVVSTKSLNYYYVLLTGDKTAKTSDSVTEIDVRNISGKTSDLGYGLLVGSDPTKVLIRDYGFLIDSERQSYRIVKHVNADETKLVGWTKFPAINKGTDINRLKVEDKNGIMTFYINDVRATSVTASENLPQGVPGVYVSGKIPIGFSNLKISR